jgi:hypothetical protein
VGKELGATASDLSPWYQARIADIARHGGGPLLQIYKNNIYKMLFDVCSEVEWEPWRFKVIPRSASKDLAVLRRALKAAEPILKIESPEDWKRISNSCLEDAGIHKLVTLHGGLEAALLKLSSSSSAS